MPDGLDDLIDSDSSLGQGGALRKQLEQVLAQNKALTEQLASVQVNERNRSLDALFAKHQIPPLARDLFPKDADATDEAATALVEKYGALWGAQAQAAATPPAEQAATQALQQFVSQTPQSPIVPLSEADYEAKFAEAKTKDEFLRMLAELSASGA